jgi:hypothetical protein
MVGFEFGLCFFISHADYLVSGDKSDLLKLGVIEDIPIITARQALDILEQRIK